MAGGGAYDGRVRPSLLALFVLGSLTGCPSKTAPPPAATTSNPSESATPEPEPLPEPEAQPPEPAPGPCRAGGRLWDGKQENCSYEHGGCCYESAADACAAADCAVERCNVLESYPAQIACQG